MGELSLLRTDVLTKHDLKKEESSSPSMIGSPRRTRVRTSVGCADFRGKHEILLMPEKLTINLF